MYSLLIKHDYSHNDINQKRKTEQGEKKKDKKENREEKKGN